jgi:hypothetical protein
MGFFDRIRKGKLFFGKTEPQIVVEFLFKGKKYVLEAFDMDFGQDTNARNQPEGEVSGGVITFTISEPPDEWLTAWMLNLNERRDGEFRFLINSYKITESAALNIAFKEAVCVSYQKVIHPVGVGLLTTLVISPRWVRVGNEEFENRG